MYSVDLYGRARRACHVEGMSKSAPARRFGIDRKTVAKMLEHAVPPRFRRTGPPLRPKLDPFMPIIDQILEEDKGRLKKNGTPRSGSSSGCGTSTASPVGSRSLRINYV